MDHAIEVEWLISIGSSGASLTKFRCCVTIELKSCNSPKSFSLESSHHRGRMARKGIACKNMKYIKVIDSHTGGEPTRIIVEGGPDLGNGPLADRVKRFHDQFDEIRCAAINEPRGSDVLVGGLLCEPNDPSADTGVIFFNNAGYLGMCGHGTIGFTVTLQYLGQISKGKTRIDTPVGVVEVELEDEGKVTVQNVRSYRLHADVEVNVPNYGKLIGDVAWGGNWFFLVKNIDEQIEVKNVRHLTHLTMDIRRALEEQGTTGPNGEWVDHIEVFSAPHDPANNSRNFVLCPGSAYDRSPCGTGTSAKLACLAADGKLAPGEIWRQESVVGSVFECSYQNAEEGDGVIPTIRGSAFICGESTLILDPADPFCMGIPS